MKKAVKKSKKTAKVVPLIVPKTNLPPIESFTNHDNWPTPQVRDEDKPTDFWPGFAVGTLCTLIAVFVLVKLSQVVF